MAILVNPNSPTGRHVPRVELEAILARTPGRVRVRVDEAYTDYVDPEESLERFAVASPNVIVCKSLSKVYALSGLRAAYLACPPRLAQEIRSVTPPWVIGLPAQVAAVEALKDPRYYARCYAETRLLRKELLEGLRALGRLQVQDGVANFLLCRLPEQGPDAASVLQACRRRGLFLRDASTFGASLGPRSLRIAVKDRETNLRMLEIIRAALNHAG